MAAQATSSRQYSHREMGVTTRSKADEDDEARKEELRRFVREKWSRIRELEKQTSPEELTDDGNRNTPRSSATREARPPDSRHTSVVEYDPENPFDDDKGREKRTPRENRISQSKQAMQKMAKASSIALSSRQAGPSLNRIPLRSSSPPKQQARRSRDKAAVFGGRQAERPSVARKEVSQTLPQERLEHFISKELTVLRKNGTIQSETSSSKERGGEIAIGKSISHESALSKGDRPKRDEASARSERCLEDASVNQDKIMDDSARDTEGARAVKETPSKRRRRRSEIPHHQPSSSPVALSVETSSALAELEASLARLKLHGYSSSRSKGRISSEIKESDEPTRPRRSLSPVKELRQMQMERDRERRLLESNHQSVSFLRRIEQASEEKATKPPEETETIPRRRKTVHTLSTSSSSSSSQITFLTQKHTQEDEGDQRRLPGLFRTTELLASRRSSPIEQHSRASGHLGSDKAEPLKARTSHFLQGFRILVDVRDQDGEDASREWVEKLERAGARVFTKAPQVAAADSNSGFQPAKSRMTHVIYKNGKPSTLHYLRTMTLTNQHPPIVVGVKWIAQCVEQHRNVDEVDYLVEIGKHAAFYKQRPSLPSAPATRLSHAGSNQQALAELVAKRKTIQNAPAQPSPLARRCWNMDASTSSSLSTVTN